MEIEYIKGSKTQITLTSLERIILAGILSSFNDLIITELDKLEEDDKKQGNVSIIHPQVVKDTFKQFLEGIEV